MPNNIVGYDLFFKVDEDVLVFPITPGEMTINLGSNNETITLINGGDINILKSPSLCEISFEARFPMRNYPYSRPVEDIQSYWRIIEKLKTEKKSFRFIMTRATPKGKRTWDTNLLMALEEIEIKESADEGDDVLVSFKLKQYKEYGVKTHPTPKSNTAPKTTSTSNKPRNDDNKTSKSHDYTVKSGDCLWNIAKQYYGDATKWQKIYDANKTVIENTAKKYRNGKGSSNGHWIYPGCKLTIPAL